MRIFKEEFRYKETHVKILTEKRSLAKAAFDEIIKQRTVIEEYIKKDLMFLPSLKPCRIKDNAPEIIKKMANAAKIADVGPMAAVAGTLAEYGCKKMIKLGAQVAIVENGGDIYAYTKQDMIIGTFTGQTKIKENLAFKLNKTNTPIGICSSSSKLGHSLSFGKCDLATIFSKDGSIADTVATAAANKVKTILDIEPTLNWLIKLKGVEGAVIIKDNKVGMIGNIPKIILAKDEKLKEKITKEDFYEL